MSRRADWVYRGHVQDVAGVFVDQMGTYASAENVITPGIVGANIAWLYDSHNFTANTASGQFDQPRIRVMAPGRAEAKRAFIKHVQGVVFFRPSTWAVGSSFRIGLRFGIFHQDPSNGGLLIDPAYSMWTDNATNTLKTPVWANDRKWQREFRLAQTFDDNDQVWAIRVNFAVRRSLDPHEGYGIWCESAEGSVNLFPQFWLRTLVADEG